jgi:zinc/manganese transport system permease protein
MTSLQDYLDIATLLAPSLATAFAVGVAGSIVGTFILLRKEAMLALALPQVIAVGVAVGMRMNWPTLPPAIGAAGVAVTGLAATQRHRSAQWLLPALYVAGLCFSFLVIANAGAHVSEMQNAFTGIDVAVAPGEAAFAVPALLIVAGVVAALWRRWLLLSQAPVIAELAGLSPGRWHLLFLVLTATVLVLGTNALGVVLVLAMLFLPAATVLPWVRRVPTALVAAPIVAVMTTAGGFVLSVEMNWPMSQSIGALAVLLTLMSATFNRLAQR